MYYKILQMWYSLYGSLIKLSNQFLIVLAGMWYNVLHSLGKHCMVSLIAKKKRGSDNLRWMIEPKCKECLALDLISYVP